MVNSHEPPRTRCLIWYRTAGLASRNQKDLAVEIIEAEIRSAQHEQELDRAKRLKLVWEIQRKLEAGVARPMLGRRKEYFTQWPHVKNLGPHNALSNYGRMLEVWLDK